MVAVVQLISTVFAVVAVTAVLVLVARLVRLAECYQGKVSASTKSRASVKGGGFHG